MAQNMNKVLPASTQRYLDCLERDELVNFLGEVLGQANDQFGLSIKEIARQVRANKKSAGKGKNIIALMVAAQNDYTPTDTADRIAARLRLTPSGARTRLQRWSIQMPKAWQDIVDTAAALGYAIEYRKLEDKK
jgi:hypothetical protein